MWMPPISAATRRAMFVLPEPHTPSIRISRGCDDWHSTPRRLWCQLLIDPVPIAVERSGERPRWGGVSFVLCSAVRLSQKSSADIQSTKVATDQPAELQA